MPKFNDLTGQKIGRWQILSLAGKKPGYNEYLWNCRCECGTAKQVNGSTIKTGRSKSCGCYSADLVRKHGMDGTPTYNAWAHMLTRCNNVRHKQYPEYGGRGIKVCDEWHKFENFFADMGEKPDGYSLDRIDNDAGYSKANCRWATITQQIRNRRVSVKREHNGIMKSAAEIAAENGIKWRTVYERLRRGMSIEDAVSPVKFSRWGTKSSIPISTKCT